MREPKRLLYCNNIEVDGPQHLRDLGPLVRVQIGPHPDEQEAVQSANRPSVTATLMIDTGAWSTLVDDHTLVKLGLRALRLEPVYGIFAEPEDCPIYRLALTLPLIEDGTGEKHNVVLPAMEIGGLPRREPPNHYMGLLGRDCLMGLGLVYDGPSGSCFLNRDTHINPSEVVPLLQAAKNRTRRRP